jgi:hypothetical protein
MCGGDHRLLKESTGKKRSVTRDKMMMMMITIIIIIIIIMCFGRVKK